LRADHFPGVKKFNLEPHTFPQASVSYQNFTL
jgi:hypothetical protein